PLAADSLDAIDAVGWREILAARRPEIAVAVGRRGAYAEGLDGLVDDGLRQHVDALLPVDPQLEHLPEFVPVHADQADISEIDELTALHTRVAGNLPASHDAIERLPRASGESLALTERQRIHRVHLDRVRDVAFRAAVPHHRAGNAE